MTVLLHEGHQHTETAASAASAVGSEVIVGAVVGMMLAILLLGYTIKQHRG